MTLLHRPRRLRQNPAIRHLVQETHLHPEDLILPLFVQEGPKSTPIQSMPGCFRYSLNDLIKISKEAQKAGISGIAIFPVIEDKLKSPNANEALNPNNLTCRTIRAIKDTIPDLLVISDIALDPYSSDGHDGLVKNGNILNDETVEILAEMAVLQAEAGSDIVAPSDMMDGRVAAIRSALDQNQQEKTLIMSYAAKYCSSLYGPFRDALNSEPRKDDKKTYQMNPANRLEAQRECQLDIQEGADILMIKPGIFYLDIIRELANTCTLPIAAYQVSGEYSMIMNPTHTQEQANAIMQESLLCLKRAGASMIFTYAALEIAKRL